MSILDRFHDFSVESFPFTDFVKFPEQSPGGFNSSHLVSFVWMVEIIKGAAERIVNKDEPLAAWILANRDRVLDLFQLCQLFKRMLAVQIFALRAFSAPFLAGLT